MGLALTSVEAEVKSRLRSVGAFTAPQSIERMRYGILRAATTLANLRDWAYLNATETMTTTDGTLGPYDAPENFLRLASHYQVSLFGFLEKDVLSPILATDDAIYTPYFQIQDGKIYFFSNPGSGSVVLNYVAVIVDDIEESALTATLAIIPSGLKPSLVDYAVADVMDDLPSSDTKVDRLVQKARASAEDYWHQSTLSQVQRGISPKGVNKVSMDNHAQSMSIYSFDSSRYRVR